MTVRRRSRSRPGSIPDVITLDVMMPKLDGWTVLGKLKSDPALASIPVIMLTIVDERTMGYSLGAAEYMTKPVDRNRLLELLRRFAAKAGEAVVLVVDDSEDVRAVVRQTVEKSGLKTVEAENGQAALDWLEANPAPALVLLDLMMPVMDGFTFLERVKSIPALARVPIVVLTAKDLTEAERRVVNERTLLVLTKGAQPLSSLGSALAAIARQPAQKVVRMTISPVELKEQSAMPKILLVEDNEMNRDMLSRRLLRNGFEVVMAVNGQEGVDMTASEKPDLVLMDMSLPVMDGWEATRRLKADDATRAIPVIALTAHAMESDREQAMQAGCDDFDTKPIELPRLLGKINALLPK